MYGGLIGTDQRSFEQYHPDRLWPLLTRNWGFATYLPPLISGTGKASDFKFGGYIYMAIQNKSPLKIVEKMERDRIQRLSKFFGYPLSQERVKLRTSNFVESVGTKAHEKFWEQQPWAQSGSPENFQGTHVQGALRGHLCDSTAFT